MKKILTIRQQLLFAFIPTFLLMTTIVGITSYAYYSQNIVKFTNNQIESSSYQCLKNYETYFDSVITTSNSIEKKISISNFENEENKLSIAGFFDDLRLTKEEIISIALYNLNGEILVSSSNYINDEDIFNSNWFIDAKLNPQINTFSNIEVTEDDQYGFILSKLLNYGQNNEEAIIKIDYDFSKVIKLISETDLGSGGHITIYDNDYNVIYSSIYPSKEETKHVKETVLGDKIIELNGIQYYMSLSTVSKTRWKVAIFTNYENVNSVMVTFFWILFSTSLGLTVIFSLLIYFASTGITNPLKLLQQEMSKIESLNYNENISKTFNNNAEVKDLSKSFNNMMLRIKELSNQIIKEEQEKTKSELKALQNQINPHFLYNTLDSIIYLIEKKDNEKAEEMIIALSKFFRISISKGAHIIPLEREIEHVTSYLKIQKIRYGKMFDFIIECDKSLYKYNVIKLILQPIVENSLLHGLKEIQDDNPGWIKISVKEDNNFLRFDILDNGYGILPKKVEEIYESLHDENIKSGVGIKNVYQRLKIYYGDKADIKIYTELDKGTDIALFIPLEELKNDTKN